MGVLYLLTNQQPRKKKMLTQRATNIALSPKVFHHVPIAIYKCGTPGKFRIHGCARVEGIAVVHEREDAFDRLVLAERRHGIVGGITEVQRNWKKRKK